MKIVGSLCEKTREFMEHPVPISFGVSHSGWITREEAAQILGKSIKTIDRLRAKGILQDLVLNRRIFIMPESLEAYGRRPIQPISNGAEMMMISRHIYDEMTQKAMRAEAVSAQLSLVMHQLTELQTSYDAVALKYDRICKEQSSSRWYQKLISTVFSKDGECREQNAMNRGWAHQF